MITWIGHHSESLLLVGVLAAAMWIAIQVLTPRPLMTLGFLIWGLNMSLVAGSFGAVSLVVGGALILAAARRQRIAQPLQRKVPQAAYVPVVMGVMGLALAPASIDLGMTLHAVAGMFWLGLLAVIVSTRVPAAMVAQAGFCALLVYTMASYVMGVLGIGGSELSGRWYGTVGNPNALGILAMMLIVVALGVNYWAVLVALVLGGGLVVFSASRGSAVATAAGVLAAMWTIQSRAVKGRWASRLLIVAGLALVVVAVQTAVNSPVQPSSEQELLRGADSGRLSLIAMNVPLFLTNPWTGYGAGLKIVGEVPGAHFFPAVIAVQMGVAGVLALLWMTVVLLRTPWRRSPMVAALVFSGLASLVFESWLFGVGYVMTAVFWTALAAGASEAACEDLQLKNPSGLLASQPSG